MYGHGFPDEIYTCQFTRKNIADGIFPDRHGIIESTGCLYVTNVTGGAINLCTVKGYYVTPACSRFDDPPNITIRLVRKGFGTKYFAMPSLHVVRQMVIGRLKVFNRVPGDTQNTTSHCQGCKVP